MLEIRLTCHLLTELLVNVVIERSDIQSMWLKKVGKNTLVICQAVNKILYPFPAFVTFMMLVNIFKIWNSLQFIFSF